MLNSSYDLAHQIAYQLDMPTVRADAQRFADGEVNMVLDTPTLIADKKMVIVAGTHPPVHEHLMDLVFSARTLNQAGINDLTVVIPYFGYSRQDKGFLPGHRGPAEVVVNMLESAGITRCICLDLHSELIMDYFSISVHNVRADSVIAQHIKSTFDDLSDVCIVAPDCGALDRALVVAEELGVEVVMFEKNRCGVNRTMVVRMEGACEGKTAIIIDDIVDTGGTAIQTADRLKARGAEKVYGYFVHPVLSGNAAQRLQESSFDGVFVSNSIPLPEEKNVEKINVFDVSSLLADAVKELV